MKPKTLPMLEDEVRRCRRCRLADERTHTVFSRGSDRSGICFIGEAPGAVEDQEAQPFVGPAGLLLDRIVARMGLDRDDVYVMNTVKCRPPGNRAPKEDELAACRGFMDEQLELIQPSVIVLLGGVALHAVMGSGIGWISQVRGTWLELLVGRNLSKVPVMPTYHPAYLLRTPGAKRKVWSDMKLVLEKLGLPVPERSLA